MTVESTTRRPQQETTPEQPLVTFAPTAVRALQRLVSSESGRGIVETQAYWLRQQQDRLQAKRANEVPCVRLSFNPWADSIRDRIAFAIENHPAPGDEILEQAGFRVLIAQDVAALIRSYAELEIKQRPKMYAREGKPYDKPFEYGVPYGIFVWYAESDFDPGFVVEPQRPLRKKPTGQLALVHQEECTGCLICYGQCPVEAIVIVPGPDRRTVAQLVEVNYDRCIGCRECVVCPYDLVEVLPRAKVMELKDQPDYTIKSFFK
jgi:ferredoxin